MRRNLAKRLEVLEAKAKPRVISSWVDFMMCEDDEVELSPELEELLVELTTEEDVEALRVKPEFRGIQWNAVERSTIKTQQHRCI